MIKFLGQAHVWTPVNIAVFSFLAGLSYQLRNYPVFWITTGIAVNSIICSWVYLRGRGPGK